MESLKVNGEPVLTQERIADLFNEAVHLASTAPPSAATTFGVPQPCDAISAIWKAQELLKKDFLDRISDAIRLAAAKGLTTADVFEFHGNQKFQTGDSEEFPLLFLLKGPTDHEQRHKLSHDGFMPLLEALRREVAPFELRHSWMPGTNTNKITLSWH